MDPAMSLIELSAAIAEAASNPGRAAEIAGAAAAAVAPDGGRGKTFIAVAADVAPDPGRASDALLGCVFGLKDNIDAAGFTTTCGSRTLEQEPPAAKDSWIAAALKKAGAQCIGKNNMHEFALGGTGVNARFGTTANPWDWSRTCGGSSGGSASAVAQRQVHLSLGTDSGGSVRQPAAFVGVAGYKPTANTLPMDGVAGAAWSIDCLGLFTQTVKDLRTIWSAIVEPDAAAPAAPRIGYLADDSMGVVEPVVWDHYMGSVEKLKAAGAAMTPISIGGFNDCPFICITIAYAEIASLHYELMRSKPNLYDQEIRGLITLGDAWSARHYLDAERRRTLHRARFAEIIAPFDTVLTPAVAIQPPRIGEQPHVTGEGPATGVYTLMRFTVLHNITGYPGITVPSGLDRDGLPTGIQLIGRPRRDAELLALAAWAEEALGPTPAPAASL
jgi:aspartyl-tRNA(Asn)/glutamyl-tRNA(Gln) amidotransferase subunit A